MVDKLNEPWVEPPNTVLAGPAVGPDKLSAGFRRLVAADLPSGGVNAALTALAGAE